MKLARALLLVAAVCVIARCSDDPEHRVATVFRLSREGTPASFARIRVSLADPDARVRAAALDALLTSADATAIESASRALEDPDASVRAVAAKGLGERRATAATSRLIQLLASDPAGSVRRRAAEALALLGGTAAGAAVADALSDTSRDVRLAATRACAVLGSADCFESLARVILDDPEWEVRVAAAEGLARSGRQEATGALRSATADPNEFVRAAAAAALATLAEAQPPAAAPEEPARSVPRSAPSARPSPGTPRPSNRGLSGARRRPTPSPGVYSALRSGARGGPHRRRWIDRASG